METSGNNFGLCIPVTNNSNTTLHQQASACSGSSKESTRCPKNRGFSTLAQSALEPDSSLLWGCAVHCSMCVASLAFTPYMPLTSPSPPVVTTKMSPDVAKCPQGDKVTPD